MKHVGGELRQLLEPGDQGRLRGGQPSELLESSGPYERRDDQQAMEVLEGPADPSVMSKWMEGRELEVLRSRPRDPQDLIGELPDALRGGRIELVLRLACHRRQGADEVAQRPVD